MKPDRVDFIFKGEMQGVGGSRHLFRVAASASRRHSFRMGGLGNQACMSFFDFTFIVDTFMAGGACQLVGGIKYDSVMTALAADLSRGRCHCLGHLLLLGPWRGRLLGPAAAQQQQNYEEGDDGAIHILDTVP